MAQQESTPTRGTLLVVDGHSLAFRAFFALPVDNFSTSSGQATNAVWGFASMLSQVIDAEKPDHLAVAFDVKGGTFRNELLPQYKGTRDAAPEELLTQLPLIQEMLAALGVTYIEKPGYEGDDVIGTLATMGEKAGYHTLVLSGDRDAFQLIDDNITVLYPGHHFKDLKHMTPEAVVAKYKVTPQQYPDLAALRGETADNIPGVPGVGDGFAAKWISQYGSLDAIRDHADEIGGKKGEALRANIDQVMLNRKVNALVRDVDLGVTVDDLTFSGIDAARLDALFTKLEFGVRTKSRLMKTFNNGVTSKLSTDVTGTADDSAALDLPHAEHVTDAASLRSWAERHLPAQGGGAGDETSDSGTSDADASGWVLHASGDARPGRATIDAVILLADGAAVIIDKPASADETIIDALRDVVGAHASTMTVHGYKEHLHLLAAAGVALPAPAFDTKLAGYLIKPDFHADTLEQAAAQFLDLHLEEQEEATQGLLDLDAGDDTTADGADAASNGAEPDQSVLRDAAIVAALARELGPRIAADGQSKLLTDIELPVPASCTGWRRKARRSTNAVWRTCTPVLRPTPNRHSASPGRTPDRVSTCKAPSSSPRSCSKTWA